MQINRLKEPSSFNDTTPDTAQLPRGKLRSSFSGKKKFETKKISKVKETK
jgi:hypothetical protein